MRARDGRCVGQFFDAPPMMGFGSTILGFATAFGHKRAVLAICESLPELATEPALAVRFHSPLRSPLRSPLLQPSPTALSTAGARDGACKGRAAFPPPAPRAPRPSCKGRAAFPPPAPRAPRPSWVPAGGACSQRPWPACVDGRCASGRASIRSTWPSRRRSSLSSTSGWARTRARRRTAMRPRGLRRCGAHPRARPELDAPPTRSLILRPAHSEPHSNSTLPHPHPEPTGGQRPPADPEAPLASPAQRPSRQGRRRGRQRPRRRLRRRRRRRR